MKEIIDIIESIAIIIASLSAIFGINSWRVELLGKKRYELAEEVLALFYKSKDVIAHIRNPFAWGGEGQSREPGPDESPDEKRAYDQAYVFFERYQEHKEVFNRLLALRYRFIVLFGQDKAAPFSEIQKTVHEILGTARMLSRFWKEGKYNEYTQKYENVVWDHGDEDQINTRINKAVADMEAFCNRIIKKKPRVLYFQFKKRKNENE
ncbi:hypothetical protein ACFL6O_03200 [candidate division KSB1 bacterium]